MKNVRDPLFNFFPREYIMSVNIFSPAGKLSCYQISIRLKRLQTFAGSLYYIGYQQFVVLEQSQVMRK